MDAFSFQGEYTLQPCVTDKTYKLTVLYNIKSVKSILFVQKIQDLHSTKTRGMSRMYIPSNIELKCFLLY